MIRKPLLAIVVCLSAAGCEDKPAKPTLNVGWNVATQGAEAPSATATAPVANSADPIPELPDEIIRTDTVRKSAAAAPDPDQAIVESARGSAAGCFGPVRPGAPASRTASIQVTVVPTGRVTRTAVSAPGADEGEIACFRRVGSGLTFTPKTGPSALGGEIRQFSIDVTVSAPARPAQ